MRLSKTLLALILIPVLCCLFTLVTFVIFPLSKYPLENTEDPTTSDLLEQGNIEEGLSSYLIKPVRLEVPTNTSIDLPIGYTLAKSAALPDFIEQNGNQLIVKASKAKVGTYNIYLEDPLSNLFNESFYIRLTLDYKDIDTNNIKAQIQSYLGSEVVNYGIYVYDLNRKTGFGLNENTQFRAASMVKVPIAITLMKEIEDEKLSLNTVYPLQENLIFNYTVGAGAYPVGTPLKVKDYLTSMLVESDNTSLSHIDALLSEVYGSNFNQHIKSIIGVDFYVNPPEATPKDVAEVLQGLYSNSFLKEENSKYIIDLLRSALPDLKQGIGLGLPSDVTYANKIGFLDTDQDLSFMDSAIVYGSATDYVIVIMDKNQDWDVAQQNIKQISTIIYNNLN